MQHAYNRLTQDQIGVSWICVRFYKDAEVLDRHQSGG